MARKTKRPRTLLQRVREDARKVALAPTEAEVVEPIEAVDGRRVWSLVESRLQEQRVEQLMLGTNSPRAIVRAMGEQFGLKSGRVELLMMRVRARWVQEDQEARPTNRAEAERRIKQYLLMARGERAPQTAQERELGIPGKWITRPDHLALHRFESLLAEIQGTLAPVQVELSVDVRVQQSLQVILSNLTPEQMTERLARARERRDRLRMLDGGPAAAE